MFLLGGSGQRLLFGRGRRRFDEGRGDGRDWLGGVLL